MEVEELQAGRLRSTRRWLRNKQLHFNMAESGNRWLKQIRKHTAGEGGILSREHCGLQYLNREHGLIWCSFNKRIPNVAAVRLEKCSGATNGEGFMEWTAISRILLLGLSVYLDRDHMKGKREAEFPVLETVVQSWKMEWMTARQKKESLRFADQYV